jgi:hypothetical protein
MMLLLVAAGAVTCGCLATYPVAVATPIRAALDVSRFQRVVVAGFVTGEHDPIDTNAEMVRLLGSQLRTRAQLGVVASEPAAIVRQQLDDHGYWRRFGEEHATPLIVTGTASFTSQLETTRLGTQIEALRASGRMRAPAMVERTRFTLDATVVFIDGGTGATLYTHAFREDALYSNDEKVFALSAYFELMDRMLPPFLRLVSDQVFYGTRILLK